jgi:hypothetical protein
MSKIKVVDLDDFYNFSPFEIIYYPKILLEVFKF